MKKSAEQGVFLARLADFEPVSKHKMYCSRILWRPVWRKRECFHSRPSKNYEIVSFLYLRIKTLNTNIYAKIKLNKN